eukprot:GFUD01025362.1.p1 GENE.GFUD01025362.1~~GFUD01025362.1.p1  ORF type:complete len:205 (-),score=20.98 GFUD01025362.1:97-711(-)
MILVQFALLILCTTHFEGAYSKKPELVLPVLPRKQSFPGQNFLGKPFLESSSGIEGKCKNGRTIVDGPFGGISGTPFTDSSYAIYGYPTQMKIRSGAIIDAIRVRYGAHEAPQHGGDGGTPHDVTLQTGEKITEIRGNYGEYYIIVICQLTFTTNLGRIFGPFGDHQCDIPFKSVHRGCNFSHVSGITGKEINYLVSLSLHWCC